VPTEPTPTEGLPSPDDRRQALAGYAFQGVHPRLRFGTASDRYAGWIGQVYPEARWHDKVQTRKKKLGGETFEEHQLPILSVQDYFRHFSVLELDFTFYRPLLEEDGRPGSNHFVLQEYAECAPPEARFLLKAPQAFSARILRQGRGYAENPEYLDARGYADRFVEPAVALLGDRLAGVLFEQEYSRVSESPEPEAFAAGLDGFFRSVPGQPQVHLEVRSAHLLTPAYFEVLHRHGLGFCFSHWTWLPSLKEQWERLGGTPEAAFPAADRTAVVRLLTPRGMPYAEAFAKAYPFDAPAPGLADTPQARQMVDEATALAYRAVEAGVTLSVIANNRAWGNSPALAQAVAARFLDFAPQRGA
jgi:uncharacterized protein YecE (DUF72 family)